MQCNTAYLDVAAGVKAVQLVDDLRLVAAAAAIAKQQHGRCRQARQASVANPPATHSSPCLLSSRLPAPSNAVVNSVLDPILTSSIVRCTSLSPLASSCRAPPMASTCRVGVKGRRQLLCRACNGRKLTLPPKCSACSAAAHPPRCPLYRVQGMQCCWPPTSLPRCPPKVQRMQRCAPTSLPAPQKCRACSAAHPPRRRR